MKPVTVGVTTRNRPKALVRAVASLASAADLIEEVLVFDDGSIPPAASTLDVTNLGTSPRIVRVDEPQGCIAARNRLVDTARTPFVFLMDDDAALVSDEALRAALQVCLTDAQVAAVAFSQAELDGRRWPLAMQPATSTVPSVVRSFIGFAHLLRRDVFRDAGGYQELFVFQGEEKELCIRLLDAGYRVVYLPDALVIHAPDPMGRDAQRYLRNVTRNDCLTSVLRDPWLRVCWVVPARLALYFRMRQNWRINDQGGFGWILRELRYTLPAALAERRPVSWRALREWRRLGRAGVPYSADRAAAPTR